jgi:Fe-S-cluster formation regulator IscX/YfhJ
MDNNIGQELDDGLPDVNPESLVAEVRAELSEIDSMEVSDHASRFEDLHQKLNTALSSIDGM